MAEGILQGLRGMARTKNENEKEETPEERRRRQQREREEEQRRRRQRGRDADYHRENRGMENDNAVAQSLKKLFGRN